MWYHPLYCDTRMMECNVGWIGEETPCLFVPDVLCSNIAVNGDLYWIIIVLSFWFPQSSHSVIAILRWSLLSAAYICKLVPNVIPCRECNDDLWCPISFPFDRCPLCFMWISCCFKFRGYHHLCVLLPFHHILYEIQPSVFLNCINIFIPICSLCIVYDYDDNCTASKRQFIEISVHHRLVLLALWVVL